MIAPSGEPEPEEDRRDGSGTDGPPPAPPEPVVPTDTWLEIEVVGDGHRSVLNTIVTTLSRPASTRSYRFVGRLRDATGTAVAIEAASAPFPVPPDHRLERLRLGDPWADEVLGRITDLDRTLRERGWRQVGRGEAWWSRVYLQADQVDDEPLGSADRAPEL